MCVSTAQEIEPETNTATLEFQDSGHYFNTTTQIPLIFRRYPLTQQSPQLKIEMG